MTTSTLPGVTYRLLRDAADYEHMADIFRAANAADGIEWVVDAATLLTSEGYEAVRFGFGMLRPTLDDLPHAALPDGLDLHPVKPEDHRAIFDADNEAFRDSWGHGEATEEDFIGIFARPDLDT